MILSSRIKYFLILPLLFLLSCSDKDKDYDKTKAISVFISTDSLKLDATLENIKITLPAQQKNNFWNGSNNEQNQRVENFAKDFLTKKKTEEIIIKKSSSTWEDLHFGFANRLVYRPVIKDNKIFSLDTSGYLTARDLTTKKKIWQNRIFAHKFLKNYQNPKISSADGKIFAVAGVNIVVAVDEIDGKVLWSKNISSIPVSAPISDGKLVFVTTNDNKLYALNAISGDIEWESSAILRNTAIIGAADPVFYKNSVIASFSSGEIYAIDKKTGNVLWTQDANLSKANSSDFYLNDIDATPLIKNDVIYTIGNGGLMMAIDAKKGNYLWKKEIAGITDFWLAGEFLYVINNDNKLLAIYQKTGGVKWISELPNLKKDKKPQTKIIYSGVVMAGDKLIISSVEGSILVVCPFDGAIEKTFKTGAKIFHSPIIVGDKIYLHTLGKYVLDTIELQ